MIDETFEEIEKTTGEDGFIEFAELTVGKYRITEIKAPEGYDLNNTPMDIEITKIIRGVNVIASDRLKLQLPQTGEKGIITFNAIGIFVIILAFYIKYKYTYNKN